MTAPKNGKHVGIFPDAQRVGTFEDKSPEWEEFRNGGIGGSDIAQILGISKWGTAFGVWKTKVFGKEEDAKKTISSSIHWGNVLEPVIFNEFKTRHLDEFNTRMVNATLQSKEYEFARANLDGALKCISDVTLLDGDGQPVKIKEGDRGILEIKTANAFGSSDWTDGVPQYYQTQADWYMLITGLDFVVFAVLIGGNDYREIAFRRDENRINFALDIVEDFWDNCVLPARDLKQCGAEIDEIKKYAPQAMTEDDRAEMIKLFKLDDLGHDVDLDDCENWKELRASVKGAEEIARQIEVLKADEKTIVTERKAREAELVSLENFIMQHTQGAGRVTFGSQLVYEMKKKSGRASFKSTKLKAKYPEIYAELADKGEDKIVPVFNF